MDELIYLVDASVYVFRAYYSGLPDMFDVDDNPVHAVFGFARFLGDLVERVRPEYLAVAFDRSHGGCFRNRIYPPYKANREPAPPDLKLQFERCVEFCALAGIPAFASPEYEADDIIGTLAARMRERGVRATVVSRDKDLAQLVCAGDRMWDFGGAEPMGYHDVAQRFGVAPERFADYLALRGDAVDNIPGVPGVGPKTAAALMREFHSLEDLYAGLEAGSVCNRFNSLGLRGAAAVRARLLEHREAAELALRLTRIACDAPLNVAHDQLRRRQPDTAGLATFFDRNDFGPLLRRQSERLATTLPAAA